MTGCKRILNNLLQDRILKFFILLFIIESKINFIYSIKERKFFYIDLFIFSQ